MPKLKYKNKDVDPGGEFKPFKKGIYKFDVDTIELTESSKSGEPMLAIVLKGKNGEAKNRNVYEYIVQNEGQAFRMRQFTDAIGAKPDGEIDYDAKSKMVKKIGGMPVAKMSLTANIKVEPGDDEYDPSNKVKNFIKKGAESEESEEDFEEPEEEAEDDAEAEAEEPEEEEEAEAEDEEGYTWADLEAMDLKELKAFAKENEADTKKTKSKSEDDYRAELAEEFGIEQEEAEEEDEEEAEEAEDEDVDYDAMSLGELKEACEAADLNPKGTKKVLVNRLKKAAKAGGGAEDDPF